MPRSAHKSGARQPDARPSPNHLNFDLKTLRLFISTAELGGVTRAAEELHIAPAAASRRIHEFERQFGLPLFERRPHGMALTNAGRSMLSHARHVTHTLGRMQDDAVSHLEGNQGIVRVAAPRSVVTQFLGAAIRECTERNPAIQVDLQEMDSQQVQQTLRRGVIDLGIYEAILGDIELPFVPFRSDRLALVCPRGHPLASRSAVTLADITPFAVIALGEGSAISILLERLVRLQGLKLRTRMRVSGFDSLAALVAEDLGVGVMPEAIARKLGAGFDFVCIPISEDWAIRKFLLCHRPPEDLPYAALRVVEFLGQPGPDSQRANAASANKR